MSWILTVLWVIMWIFIWILIVVAAIILLVLILCVIPVRYKVDARVGDNTAAKVRASYLFGLVRVFYEYGEGRSDMKWYLAWRQMGGEKEPRKRKKHRNKGHTPVETTKAAESDDALGIVKAEIKRNLQQFPYEHITPPSEMKAREPTKEAPPPKPEEKEESNPQSKGDTSGKLKKIRDILTDPQVKATIKLVLEALKWFGRILWPKYIDISGEVGLADPADTGFLLGAYEAIAAMLRLRRKIRIVGDFTADTTVVRLNIAVKGSISVARLTMPVIWLWTKKPIRAVIRTIRKGDFNEQ